MVSEFYNNTSQIAGQNLEVMTEAFTHQRYFDKISKFAGNVKFLQTRFNDLSKINIPFNDIDSFDFSPADENTNVTEKMQVLNLPIQHYNRLYNVLLPFSSLDNRDESLNNARLFAQVNALSKANAFLSKMLLNGSAINRGIYSENNGIQNPQVQEPKDIKELIILIEQLKAQMNAKLGLSGAGFGVLLPYKYQAIINSAYAVSIANFGNNALGERQQLYIPSLGILGEDFDYIYPVVGESNTITLIYKPFCTIILAVLPQIIGQGINNPGLSTQTEITEIGISTASFINMDTTKYAIINQPLKAAETRETKDLEAVQQISLEKPMSMINQLDGRKLEILKEIKVIEKEEKDFKKEIKDFKNEIKSINNISDLELSFDILKTDIENSKEPLSKNE